MGCDIHIAVQAKDEGKWFTVIHPGASYNGRNYMFFSILAGVRNGYGITPICEPKGLPDDFVEDDDYLFWVGDHSFSFLTLEEIYAFDWDKMLTLGSEKETYRDLCDSFFQWLDSLKNYTRLDYKDNRNIRLVFGFDN